MDTPESDPSCVASQLLEARRATLLGQLAEVERALGIHSPGMHVAPPLETMLDALPAVALVDHAGRVVMVNQAWRAAEALRHLAADGTIELMLLAKPSHKAELARRVRQALS